jgi:hypothetical protein
MTANNKDAEPQRRKDSACKTRDEHEQDCDAAHASLLLEVRERPAADGHRHKRAIRRTRTLEKEEGPADSEKDERDKKRRVGNDRRDCAHSNEARIVALIVRKILPHSCRQLVPRCVKLRW